MGSMKPIPTFFVHRGTLNKDGFPECSTCVLQKQTMSLGMNKMKLVAKPWLPCFAALA